MCDDGVHTIMGATPVTLVPRSMTLAITLAAPDRSCSSQACEV